MKIADTIPIKDAVRRNGRGQYLVLPPEPDATKEVGYTRVSNYIDTLDDRHNLEKWRNRMAAAGFAARPDLVAMIHGLDPEQYNEYNQELNGIVDQAVEAGGALVKANYGTAMHSMAAAVLEGRKKIREFPPQFQADLQAFVRMLERLDIEIEPQFLESMVVIDHLKVAGTFDYMLRLKGERMLGDLKTGSVDYGHLKMSQQLAAYRMGQLYDQATQTRTPFDDDVSEDHGLVLHLPFGQGEAFAYKVDLHKGAEALIVSGEVRLIRTEAKRGDWWTLVGETTTTPEEDDAKLDELLGNEPAPESHPFAEPEQRERPKVSQAKGTWVMYATQLGIDVTGMNKPKIINACTEHEASAEFDTGPIMGIDVDEPEPIIDENGTPAPGPTVEDVVENLKGAGLVSPETEVETDMPEVDEWVELTRPFLAERLKFLIANSETAGEMLSRLWPVDDGISSADAAGLVEIEALLDKVEATIEAPFNVDPRIKAGPQGWVKATIDQIATGTVGEAY